MTMSRKFSNSPGNCRYYFLGDFFVTFTCYPSSSLFIQYVRTSLFAAISYTNSKTKLKILEIAD